MHIFANTLAIGAFLLITACGSQEPETKITPDAVETTTTVASGHGHDHGNQPTISMSLPIAGVMLDIVAQGTLRPSSEYHLEMVLVDGVPGSTIRLWIGNASGTGSMKTKADRHGNNYHAHVLVPKEINEKTALWVELRTPQGSIGLNQIALQ